MEQRTTSIEQENILSSQAQSEQNVPRKPRKETRGLGTSKIDKAALGGKLSVTFDVDCLQPICINAERFNNEIGFIVRNHATFHYKEWRLVPEAVRAPLRHYLLEQMMILRAEHPPEELSDKDIMERVIGRCSVYLRGWGRSVSTTTGNRDHNTSAEPNLPSYQEMLEQLNEANKRVREVVDILRHNNLMPPPPTAPTHEDQNANLGDSE